MSTTVTGAANWVIPLPTILFYTLLSFIFHWSLYYIAPISSFAPCDHPNDPKKYRKHVARSKSFVVSTFHASFACLYVLIWMSQYSYSFFDVNRALAGGVWGTGDEWMQWIIYFSIGYFMWDTHCMYLYHLGSPSAYIHHIVIGGAFIAGIVWRVGHPYHFFFLLEELSTPALNMKSAFKHLPRISFISSLIFAASFLIVRLGFGSYLFAACLYTFVYYAPWAHSTGYTAGIIAVWFQLLVSSISRVLNVYWGIAIIRKVISTLSASPPPPSTVTANNLTKDESDALVNGVVDKLEHVTHTNGNHKSETNGYHKSETKPKKARSRKDD